MVLARDDLDFDYDENTYVVMFRGVFFDKENHLSASKDERCLDVMVVTQEYIYILNKNIIKEITDTINRSLIIRAKEMSNIVKQ